MVMVLFIVLGIGFLIFMVLFIIKGEEIFGILCFGCYIIYGIISLYNVILSHEPIKVENGFYNIHGHIHNNGFHEPCYSYKTHYNVSVENTEYKPILLKDILYNWDIKED